MANLEIVNAPDEVVLAVFERVDFVDFVEERGELCAVEPEPGVIIARERALECGVFFFNRGERGIDFNGDVVLLGVFHNKTPAGSLAEEEDVFRVVENRLIDERAFSVGDQFFPPLDKTVVGVFEKNEAEDDVFILGRLDGSAQLVCGLPKCFFNAFCLNLFLCHSYGKHTREHLKRKKKRSRKTRGNAPLSFKL